jgi:deazaflavin-dependent oxidoreductase (nitroreductase family)
LVNARDRGLPMPAAALVMSQYVDLTLAGETMETKREADPLMSEPALRARVADYTSGQDAALGLISPIFAELSGLSPLIIQVGTHEVLLDDAIRLAREAAAADVEVTLDITPEVPHVFHLCHRKAEPTLSLQLILPAHNPDRERQEFDMTEALDWNAKTIAEFRANEGRVGGVFEGAPLVLVHHRGRKTGQEHVSPVMYLPHDTAPGIVYVFATKGGAPTNPDWYRNLTAAGEGTIERGTATYQVTVQELIGAERDRIYAEQARRYPGFAEYARQTAGIRIIPVLELRRA